MYHDVVNEMRRRARKGCRMTDEELKVRVDAYVNEVWESVVEDIRSLVRIRSVEDLDAAQEGRPYGPACLEALERGLEIASRLGLDAHNCDGHIGYADLAGSSERYLATIAHTDVVPEGLGWSVDPYDVTRREGYLLGRGVLDDKGPFVLSLYAAHFLKRLVDETGERLPYTLRCIVGNEEETNMGDLDWYLENYPEPEFAFTPDADFPLICGEKGVFHGRFGMVGSSGGAGESRIVEMDGGTVANAIPGLATAVVRADASSLPARANIDVEPAGDGLARVRAHGRGGHASLPEGTLNAIGLLADYLMDHGICSKDERRFLVLEHALCSCGHDGAALGIKASDERFGPLTVIGGTVRMVNGHLVQTCDARYPSSTDDERIARTLTSFAEGHGCTFDVDAVKVPFYVEPDSPEIRTLLDTYDEYTGRRSEAFVIGGGTYARKFRRACAFGPHEPDEDMPSWVGPEHGADEGISEASLRRALKVYIVSIWRLMQLSYQ